MDKTLKALVTEVTQLANDLATQDIFSLRNDLPKVGDAMHKSVMELVSLDARIAALEKLHTPKDTPPPVPTSPTEGSKP